ncbi:MAG: O-antigen ligase family protein [Candidatus Tumulicola sp.]
MIHQPVVDRFAIPVPLDPWSAAVFVAAFVAAAAITSRRPAYGLCGLIVAMPFALYREFAGTTVTIPKAVLLGVLVGLTTYAGSLGALRRRPMPLLLGALGIYVAITALSALDAAHPAATARETLKFAEYGALLIAGYLCYRLDPDDPAVTGAIAVAAIAVALSALAQEFAGAPSGLYVGKAIVPRIAGVLEGPNQLAGYFQVAIAALGAWTLTRRSMLTDGALAAATCADVLTFSRAGLFGLAVVGLVLICAGGRAALRALRPAYLGIAAGLGVVGWWAMYAHTVNVLRVSLEESTYAGGVGDRGELWRAAWRMWRDRPLLGVGAGNYELELPAYGAPGLRTHANSWFLQSLAEGGIALFAATIGLIAAILVTFARRLRAGSPWVLAAFAAGVALAVHQVADYLVFYPKVGGPWWLLIGIAAATIARDDRGSEAVPS